MDGWMNDKQKCCGSKQQQQQQIHERFSNVFPFPSLLLCTPAVNIHIFIKSKFTWLNGWYAIGVIIKKQPNQPNRPTNQSNKQKKKW